MKNSFEARIRRATELSSVYPFAAQVLRFYAQLAMLQQKLCFDFQQAPTRFFDLDGSGQGQLKMDALLPIFANFLINVRQIAPDALAEAAQNLSQKSSASWMSLMEGFWFSPSAVMDGEQSGEEAPAERCLAWLFLQPAAEYLSTRRSQTPGNSGSTTCPLCGSKPIVGVLRPEGEGAKKSLICMLCAHEWSFRRICCPACGEDREPQIALYSAPEFPHVRVDVCDSCHSYLKSVDLTKTGLAVPVVDELATLPLDLWARQNGYQKLQINLAGI